MEIYSVICDNVVSVVMWRVLLLSLLLLGGFIRIRTWGNFNCRFGMWESCVSFDGLKLLIVFIVFEIEVVVVVIMLSTVMVVALMLVTVVELMVLYI